MSTTAVVDVVIAGAGPAGCATAIACARRGLEVMLLERARFPRDKACGEGLNPAGVAALAELDLLPAVYARAQRLDGIGFTVGGALAYAPFPDDGALPSYGLGVRRLDFDATLADAARAHPGVTLLQGVRARAPLHDGDRVVGIDSDAGPIRARAVVAADGLASPLRAQLGLGAPQQTRRPRCGLRVHFRVPSLPFGSCVRVLLDERDEQRREYYLTPVAPDVLQVAILCDCGELARDRLAAVTLLPSLRAHPVLGPLLAGAEALDRPRGAGPFRHHARDVVRDGALLVGDAAGYVDAITGEGMGAGLRMGLAAGDVLATAIAARRGRDPLPAAALAPYARARHAIVRDADRLTEAVLFLARHPSLARRVVQAMARRPWILQSLLRVQSGAPLASIPRLWLARLA